MKKEKVDERSDEYTFAKIPRLWKLDCLDGKLMPDELFILMWLSLLANPHNGIVKTSYEEIVSDLSIKGRNAKNKVNKTMLNLKKKQYLWYPKQQGRRSSFQVEIGGYLLSNKASKDIKYHFLTGNNEGEIEVLQKIDRGRGKPLSDELNSGSDVGYENQKSEQASQTNNHVQCVDSEQSDSRSTNNDNDNNNDNNKDDSFLSGTKKRDYKLQSKKINDSGVIEFVPQTDEEKRCKEVALWLNEKSMNYILSKLFVLDNDITKIEEAYEDTKRAVAKKGYEQINIGAYFNKTIEEKTKES